VGSAGAVLAFDLACDHAGAAISSSWKQATVTAAVACSTYPARAGLFRAWAAAVADGFLPTVVGDRLARWVAVVIIAAFLAGGLGMEAAVPRQQPRSEPPPARDVSLSTQDETRYRAALTGGATVEVVAVSSDPTNPHSWWGPDGTPLSEPLADPLPFRYRPRRRAAPNDLRES
jgi:hypothetical protein